MKVRLEGERLTPGAVPVPVKLTLCVLPATLLLLSVMVTCADSALVVEGVKVTLIVQLLFAATELPQVLVGIKSGEFVPIVPIPVIAKLTLPVLVSVIL